MSPVDSIRPTHAALHRHIAAHSAVQSSRFDVQGSTVPSSGRPEPTISKYIIVRDAFATTHSMERVIIFSQDLHHKNMVPMGCDPVSAGFCLIKDGTITIPQIGSTTLNLEPRPQDRALIAALLNTPIHGGASANQKPETVSTVS